MSGNYVQRGMPAVFDKSFRARAAIDCGADLVLELPTTYALSSAEGFAAGGVKILSAFCDALCFGSETGDAAALEAVTKALLSPAFSPLLRKHLESGCSFPAARQQALQEMGIDPSLLNQPNDILAIEYCKAIFASNSNLTPMPIRREGNYHDILADTENPSATSLRQLLRESKPIDPYLPSAAASAFHCAPSYTLEAGERAILTRLRTMRDEEFESLPYGSEGLWRKLMHAVREKATLEEILTEVKSKRYTRTRLDRMVMCAFLGLTTENLTAPAPYVRVLALNDRGRQLLKEARKNGNFPNIGEKQDHPYQAIETRCGSLYGLFCADTPEPPDTEQALRIYYQPQERET
jgi:predicted nucleotidyltransferase